MKTKYALVCFSIALLTFSSCKKEGPAGKDGEDGNANVQSVQLINASWMWSNSLYWSTSTWNNISILTSAVNNSGAVMLYEADGAGGWIAVPYSYNLGNNVTEHHFYTYAAGTVTVYIEESDDSNPNASGGTFKLVCIPSSARMANPDVDLNNYNEVKKAFHLKE